MKNIPVDLTDKKIQEVLKYNVVYMVEILRNQENDDDRESCYIEGVYTSKKLAIKRVRLIIERLGGEDIWIFQYDGCYKREADGLVIYYHYLLLNDNNLTGVLANKEPLRFFGYEELRKKKYAKDTKIYFVVQDNTDFFYNSEEEGPNGEIIYHKDMRPDSLGQIKAVFTQKKKADKFIQKFMKNFCGKRYWSRIKPDAWLSGERYFRLYIFDKVLDEGVEPINDSNDGTPI